jgi:hypothetical protein
MTQAEPVAVLVRGEIWGLAQQWADLTTPSGEKGTRRAMIARQTKKIVLARKRLQELTPAELTAVSGGGLPFRRHHHRHHHRHRRHFPFPFL